MRKAGVLWAVLVGLGLGLLAAPRAEAGQAKPKQLDRTVLPIPEPKRPAITELDVRKAKASPPVPR